MKASNLFVKCLENDGIAYIFGVPDEENLVILDVASHFQHQTAPHP